MSQDNPFGDGIPIRQSPPALPLSPISNPPGSPPRKRPRTAHWNPPSYIPSFLPPFPTDTPHHTPSPPPADLPPSAPLTSSPVKVEQLSLAIPPQETISLSKPPGDWLTPTPYELSGLASQPTWHLPTKPPTPPPSPANRLPMPIAERALYEAYHYILTHHPKTKLEQYRPGPTNPGRYKVALELVRQAETQPRWDPVPTMFGGPSPNIPRVATISPSYPIPYGKFPDDEKESKPGKGGKDKDNDEVKLPATQAKIVGGTDRLAPMVSQPTSRIPNLARELLVVSHLIFKLKEFRFNETPYSIQYTIGPHDSLIPVYSLVEQRNWFMVSRFQHHGIPLKTAPKDPPRKTRMLHLNYSLMPRCLRRGTLSRRDLIRFCLLRRSRGWGVSVCTRQGKDGVGEYMGG